MRVISGIRPSGKLHIGNYLGTMLQWKKLQKENECFFFIADLHAITTPYDKNSFQKDILDTLIAYLAVGIDPEKSIIFLQSQVKEHTELAWIFSTLSPFSELKQMTQFKEKAKKHPKNVNAGLLNYPLLMAADILLYKAEGVPVGKDQVQHLEFTREIARRFNKNFGETFPLPQPILSEGAKIMSLVDPKKKMSKTENPEGCVFLFDEPKEIERKIISAVTDSQKEIKYDPKRKPGISNLLMIFSLFTEIPIEKLEQKFKGKGYSDLKKNLVKVLVEKLAPFRKKRKELLQREVFLKEILKRGKEKASLVAQLTIKEVKAKMGFFD
ncbi:tryptophan--tRNA ligase [Candidatus Parcubacteria bacterium]|nr:tryptophan--tRNA ligase [Candidatus Parcubacteria bacterium]